jgi:general stress protein 26
MPDVKQEFAEILSQFESAMLVTHAKDGALHARPMAIAGREPSGDLWFVTPTDAPKLDELASENRVCVTLQSKTRFMSISGRCKTVKDRTLVEKMWKPDWKAWFPQGKDDPKILLLQFSAQAAEYWDEHGIKGLSYLIQGAKAVLKGEQMRVEDPLQHAKLQL